MCAEDGEPSLIFSSSVGWRREDGGGMKDASGAGTGAWALLDGLIALLGLTVVEVLQKEYYLNSRRRGMHLGLLTAFQFFYT